MTRVEEFPVAAWNLLTDVLLRGTFLVTRAVLPGMRARGFGRVIQIGSAHSLVASPYKFAYVAARHALLGFAKAVARETAALEFLAGPMAPQRHGAGDHDRRRVDGAVAHDPQRPRAGTGISMGLFAVLLALALLMLVAYRGSSVILFAPLCALLAVLLTAPSQVLPMFSDVFMEKTAGFVKLYLPVFMLGAIFGKVIELAGFSKSIVSAVSRVVDRRRAVLAIALVCAVLTYGGVSLFVVVFAVYPLAAEMFRQSDIPKRLIPGTIALGSFTFTMDAMPGSPQIQNIIPTTFFKTDTWAAPWLGLIGSSFILALGLAYLSRRCRLAAAAGEGYGTGHANEPTPFTDERLPGALLAVAPLVLVAVLNRVLASAVPRWLGPTATVDVAGHPLTVDVTKMAGLWAVEGALLVGILFVTACALRRVGQRFAEGSRAAVAGSLLASLNTASEYGFGGVIAALPGFTVVSNALKGIPNPLVKEAVTITTLAGVTGSASGGMSIALAATSDALVRTAHDAGIPLEVMHRVASMASGGMDTLPHNGAVITLLAVTGLTHRTSYRDIFAMTLIKTAAVFVVIGVYYATGGSVR